MSHTTRRQSAIKDLPTLKKALDRIPGAEYQGYGAAKQYSGAPVGHRVKLPGWHFAIAIDIGTGECQFDNYNGKWGNEAILDQLKQGYAVEAVKAKAAAENLEIEETRLDNGSIKLVIPLGDAGYVVDGESGGGSDWDV